VQTNCKNAQDPISGTPFTAADVPDIVRLHDRTCVKAPLLDSAIAAQHKAGQVATIPGMHSTPLKLEDFNALRTTMRRRNPVYKVPGRRHRPPPAEWQLYVASDARSGPDYASIAYVDITKAVSGPRGIEYPEESIRLDLGFLPLRVGDARCSAQTVLEVTQRLAAMNRLVKPVAGGWKPIAGFPYSKRYWESDGARRLTKLCFALAKELQSPF